eukprot:352598-Chlamydomonas_euryale.AAC.8
MRQDDPRSIANEDDMLWRARFNEEVCLALECLSEWQDLRRLISGYSEDLNHVTVGRICAKLATLIHVTAQEQSDCILLVENVARLTTHHMAAFNFDQLAQVAAGMAACKYGARDYWDAVLQMSSRRLPASSVSQVAALSTSLAMADLVPSLNWLQACERQVGDQLLHADPESLAALMWAWGCFNHTPSKRTMDRVKMRSRNLMKMQQLAPAQLLQLLFCVSRLTDHHPSESWMLGWATAFAPFVTVTHPCILLEVLVSLVSLQFQPSEIWLENLIQSLGKGLHETRLDGSPGEALRERAGSGVGVSLKVLAQPHQQPAWLASSGSAMPLPDPLLIASLHKPKTLSLPHDRRHAVWQQQQQLLNAHRPEVFCASELAQLVWCLDALEYLPDPRWMSCYITHTEVCLPHATSAMLADMLHGLAGIDFVPDDQFMSLASNRLQDLLPMMSSDELARSLRALSRIGFLPPWSFVEALTCRLNAMHDTVGPMGLPDIVVSLAYLAPNSADASGGVALEQRQILLRDCVARLTADSQHMLPHMLPEGLAHMGWALAMIQLKPPAPWLHEWLVCSRAHFKLMNARDLANLGWATACLQHRPGSVWLEEYSQEVARRFQAFDDQSLTDMCWALARCGFTPSDDWMEVLEADIELRCSVTPDERQTTAQAATLTAHHVAVLMWALQVFKYVPQEDFVNAANQYIAAANRRNQLTSVV